MNAKAIDLWLNFIIGALLLIGGIYSAFNGSAVFFGIAVPWWLFCLVGVAFIVWGIIQLRKQNNRS